MRSPARYKSIDKVHRSWESCFESRFSLLRGALSPVNAFWTGSSVKLSKDDRFARALACDSSQTVSLKCPARIQKFEAPSLIILPTPHVPGAAFLRENTRIVLKGFIRCRCVETEMISAADHSDLEAGNTTHHVIAVYKQQGAEQSRIRITPDAVIASQCIAHVRKLVMSYFDYFSARRRTLRTFSNPETSADRLNWIDTAISRYGSSRSTFSPSDTSNFCSQMAEASPPARTTAHSGPCLGRAEK